MAMQTISSGESGLSCRNDINANFSELYKGTPFGIIIPTDTTRAAYQTALTEAQNNSLNANGNIEVFYPYVGETLWESGAEAIGSDATRIPGLTLRFAPGAYIKKNVGTWSTDNALIQVGFAKNLHIPAMGATFDGGQTVVQGTIVNLNGTASDLIRVFSTERVRVYGAAFRNAADAAWRYIPFSNDTQQDLVHDCVLDSIDVRACNQLSTTNSGVASQAPREIRIINSYFKNLYSNKSIGSHAGGGGFWHFNNVYDDCTTGPEWDGQRLLVSKGNIYRNPVVRAISILSNNIFEDRDFANDHVDIDDYCIGGNGGVYFNPDNQADQLYSPWKYARMKMRMDDFNSADGYGFDMGGDLSNVTAHIVASGWRSGIPFRYDARGSGKKNNVHLIAEGVYDSTGRNFRRVFAVTSNSRREGRYAIDGLTLETRGARFIAFERLAIFTGTAKGTAAGATTNAAGYAIGATAITLASAGTGSILSTDKVVFAGDAAAYPLTAGDSDVSNGGTITLAAPGLLVAIPTSATAITVTREGTAAGATTSTAPLPPGSSYVPLAAAGTGTILSGEAIQFAGDTNIYPVITGNSNVAAGGTIFLGNVTAVEPINAIGATTNAAGYAIGATSITLASAGRNYILAGQRVNFTGDPNLYTVTIGDDAVQNGGTITIATPGLIQALPTSATPVNIVGGGGLRTGSAIDATTNAAGYAISATTITLAATGSGFIAAAATVRFAGDATVYTVATGNTAVQAGGTIVLSGGGLVQAIPAAATAITVVTTPTRAITILSKRFARDVTIKGDVEGEFSSGLIYYGEAEAMEGFYAKDFRYKGSVSAGLYLRGVLGGEVDGCTIDSPQDALTVDSTCAGVVIGENRLYHSGVPVAPTDSQGPFMASASRTTVTVDVTITHGKGTDYTMPTNARRMFRYFTAAGAEIAISSMSKQSSTLLRFVLASDPGGAGTLVALDKRAYNILNGAAFGDTADRPYDNSGVAAPLRAGTVAVA